MESRVRRDLAPMDSADKYTLFETGESVSLQNKDLRLWAVCMRPEKGREEPSVRILFYIVFRSVGLWVRGMNIDEQLKYLRGINMATN